jgi:hypothetical protein
MRDSVELLSFDEVRRKLKEKAGIPYKGAPTHWHEEVYLPAGPN